ncbi:MULTISPECIES: serine dehydratase subunit alpha family protein [unclassified Lacrimispora]|uniref:L-cysteine desulfidase family protein n=1 Tax=unclassified Lacrimispora TaxID=2719232 RepID=UPI00306DD930|nr:L-serine ammonia-lyase, iron-sulfur-dependent, subunit alpha [Lachnospiraceae bacterium]
MDTKDLRYTTYVQILKEELVPAMGCTEPIALGYGAAKAREVLGSLPDKVEVNVSYNIIKNVKSVVVPNTDGLKGIEAAVAAGIVAGDATKLLEVISVVSNDKKSEIRDFMNHVPITVKAIDGELTFDIVLILFKGNEYVKLRIAQYHTNIILIEKNGETLFNLEAGREQGSENSIENTQEVGLTDKSLLNLKDIIEFADTLLVKDVKDILDPQINYNMAIALEGLKNDYGANIGSTWLASYGNDVRNRAIAKAAAGSDARMSGCELPVIINSGSGNQGITVSVPVIEYANDLDVTRNKLYRALALANLISIHEKTGIGRLSAYCGAVSAGCAAACGIAYLLGGGFEEIAHTLVNSVVITSGMICDGAKPSCAGKIATSIMAGLLGHDMFKNGEQQFRSGEGIINRDVEETIRNVGRLGKDGMRETDREIVKIMIGE